MPVTVPWLRLQRQFSDAQIPLACMSTTLELGGQADTGRPEAEAYAEGWFRTGDIAVIDPDGFVRIVDRKKDLIIVSGFNVYPTVLEDVLAGLPGVLQCAAIGVPDEKSGEIIKIFIVVKPGATLTKDQVMEHMRANVTAYKVPKAVEFRDALPTTNVGKILRRELRDEELKKLGLKK